MCQRKGTRTNLSTLNLSCSSNLLHQPPQKPPSRLSSSSFLNYLPSHLPSPRKSSSVEEKEHESSSKLRDPSLRCCVEEGERRTKGSRKAESRLMWLVDNKRNASENDFRARHGGAKTKVKRKVERKERALADAFVFPPSSERKVKSSSIVPTGGKEG